MGWGRGSPFNCNAISPRWGSVGCPRRCFVAAPIFLLAEEVTGDLIVLGFWLPFAFGSGLPIGFFLGMG